MSVAATGKAGLTGSHSSSSGHGHPVATQASWTAHDFVTIGNEMSVAVVDSVELANRLRPVLLHLNRYLRREAHAEGVTGGQAALLAQIRAYPELGVRGLAAREGVSAPSMTRYLDRMEKAGLIVRSALRGRRAAHPPRADAEGRPCAALGPPPAHGLAGRAAPGTCPPAELRAVDAGDRAARCASSRTRRDRGAARAELAHVLERAEAPELPPLLLGPDRLADAARGCRTRRSPGSCSG